MKKKSKYDNLLSLGNDCPELDKPIYRVMTFARFLEAVAQKKMALVTTSMWDDPFESFLLKSEVESESGETVSLEHIRKKFYGQCWTYLAESDALWRIYAPNKDGVKLKTSIRKYFDYLYDTTNNFARQSYFGGEVAYWKENKIKQIFEQSSFLDHATSTGREMVKTLLIKREEFSHESEYRFIFFASEDAPGSLPSGAKWDSQLYEFRVDMAVIADEVVLDPRMSERDFEESRKKILNLGFPAIKVSQSKLYRLPNFRLREMPKTSSTSR